MHMRLIAQVAIATRRAQRGGVASALTPLAGGRSLMAVNTYCRSQIETGETWTEVGDDCPRGCQGDLCRTVLLRPVRYDADGAPRRGRHQDRGTGRATRTGGCPRWTRTGPPLSSTSLNSGKRRYPAGPEEPREGQRDPARAGPDRGRTRPEPFAGRDGPLRAGLRATQRGQPRAGHGVRHRFRLLRALRGRARDGPHHPGSDGHHEHDRLPGRRTRAHRAFGGRLHGVAPTWSQACSPRCTSAPHRPWPARRGCPAGRHPPLADVQHRRSGQPGWRLPRAHRQPARRTGRRPLQRLRGERRLDHRALPDRRPLAPSLGLDRRACRRGSPLRHHRRSRACTWTTWTPSSSRWTRTRTKDELARVLEAANIPCAPS